MIRISSALRPVGKRIFRINTSTRIAENVKRSSSLHDCLQGKAQIRSFNALHHRDKTFALKQLKKDRSLSTESDTSELLNSERESMPFDVLIVGGGPAGLAASIRIKQLCIEKDIDLSVCVVEKGR